MDRPDPLRVICRRWFPTAALEIVPLVGGGFSGSPVWRVAVRSGTGDAVGHHVLKGFASACSLERGRAIHRFVETLQAAGVAAVPAPLPLAPPERGSIAVDPEGGLWEMTPWRPGHPVAAPSPRQACAALETLARIHRAAWGTDGPGEVRVGPPPSWARRVDAIAAVVASRWDDPVPQPGPPSPLERAIAARRRACAAILRERGGLEWLSRLGSIVPPAVPLQPVLRDIWQAHVLFVGDEVSAVIDPHACGLDTPATDLARLLGSWEPPSAPGGIRRPLTEVWRESLVGYEAIRPLAPGERPLVDLLHGAGVIGGLEHWFRWVLEERRVFPDPAGVVGRVEFLMKNLDSILDQTDPGNRRLH